MIHKTDPRHEGFDRTELRTLLQSVWREWGLEEDAAPPSATDHGPAP